MSSWIYVDEMNCSIRLTEFISIIASVYFWFDNKIFKFPLLGFEYFDNDNYEEQWNKQTFKKPDE